MLVSGGRTSEGQHVKERPLLNAKYVNGAREQIQLRDRNHSSYYKKASLFATRVEVTNEENTKGFGPNEPTFTRPWIHLSFLKYKLPFSRLLLDNGGHREKRTKYRKVYTDCCAINGSIFRLENYSKNVGALKTSVDYSIKRFIAAHIYAYAKRQRPNKQMWKIDFLKLGVRKTKDSL